MPALKVQLQFEMEFSPAEYEQLALGLLPRDMDDRWFIFLEDNWLSIHRSWTGFCIYLCRIEPDAAKYKVVETWVNRNSEQYNASDDSWDCALLFWLINTFLLGKEVSFPSRENLTA